MQSVQSALIAALRAAGGSEISLDAYLLVADLAGFTAKSEELSGLGPLGAERLSEALRSAFEPSISALESLGGLIVGFAGDSYTVVLPITPVCGADALRSGLFAAFPRAPVPRTDLELPPLPIKAVAVRGMVSVTLHDDPLEPLCIVHGKAVREAYRLLETSQPGGILLARLRGPESSPGDAPAWQPGSTPMPDIPTSRDFPGHDEFRAVISVFVRNDHTDESSFVRNLRSIVNTSGAYMPYLDDSDKGCVAYLVFGYPYMPEDPFRNAARALAACRSLGYACGAAYGQVYAGRVGGTTRYAHTCLGASVNLACRLMQAAGPGQILVGPEESARWLPHSFLKAGPVLACKGFRSEIQALALECGEALGSSDAVGAGGSPIRFHGREPELSVLQEYWHKAEGTEPTILVSGAPGIGKSALVHEAARRGGRKLVRFAPDLVGNPSLSFCVAGCLDMLRQSGLQRLPENFVKTNASRDAVHWLLGDSGAGALFRALAETEKPEALAKGIVSLATELALPPGTVFFIDDWDRLPPADQALAQKLSARARSAGYVLAVASRQAQAFSLCLALDPLPLASAIQLLAPLLPEQPPARLESLAAAAAGNPLFLTELARANTGRRPDEPLLVPTSLRDLIVSRIDAVGREQGEQLRRAAVFGEEFGRHWLAELHAVLASGIGEVAHDGEAQSPVPDDFPALPLSIGILRDAGPESLGFAHRPYQEVAYSLLLATRRQVLHRAALEVLRPLVAADKRWYPALVFHALSCGDPAIAVESLRAGLEWAERQWRNTEALAWSRELLSRDCAAADHAFASLVQFRILIRTGGLSEALPLLDRARALATAASAIAQADLESELALALMEDGEINQAEVPVTRLAGLLEAIGDPAARSRIRNVLSIFWYYKGDLALSRAHAEVQYAEAQKAMAEMAGKDAAVGRILLARACASMAGVLLVEQKDKDEPLVWLARQLEWLEGADDPSLLSECYYYKTVIHHRRTEWDEAERFCRLHMELAESLGDTVGRRYALARLGAILVMTGRFGDGERVFGELLGLSLDAGARSGVATARTGLGNACFYSGRFEEALRHYLESFAVSKDSGNTINRSVAAWAVGRSYFELGDTSRALAFFYGELREARKTGDSLGIGLSYGYIGITAGYMGMTDKALECIRFSLAKCLDFDLPCRTSRLYLEAVRFALVRYLREHGVYPEGRFRATLLGWCGKARSDAAKVVEPIVLDIPWQVRLLEVRLASGPAAQALRQLLESVDPAQCLPRDRALWYLESSRLAESERQRLDLLALARGADPGIVERMLGLEAMAKAPV